MAGSGACTRAGAAGAAAARAAPCGAPPYLRAAVAPCRGHSCRPCTGCAFEFVSRNSPPCLPGRDLVGLGGRAAALDHQHRRDAPAQGVHDLRRTCTTAACARTAHPQHRTVPMAPRHALHCFVAHPLKGHADADGDGVGLVHLQVGLHHRLVQPDAEVDRDRHVADVRGQVEGIAGLRQASRAERPAALQLRPELRDAHLCGCCAGPLSSLCAATASGLGCSFGGPPPLSTLPPVVLPSVRLMSCDSCRQGTRYRGVAAFSRSPHAQELLTKTDRTRTRGLTRAPSHDASQPCRDKDDSAISQPPHALLLSTAAPHTPCTLPAAQHTRSVRPQMHGSGCAPRSRTQMPLPRQGPLSATCARSPADAPRP